MTGHTVGLLRTSVAALALGVMGGAALARNEAPVPVLETAVGSVKARMSKSAPWTGAAAGMRLPDGMSVRTGANARAIIRYSSTDLVRMAPLTELTVGSIRSAQAGLAASLVELAVGRVRVMLHRARRSAQPDFITVAGSAVCAVKGTVFEVDRPSAANSDGVSVRVDDGAVLVGQTRGDARTDFIRTFDAITHGTGGREVGRGFGVTVDRGAALPAPARIERRPGLDLVSAVGRVYVVTAGGKDEISAGETIPPGANLVVEDGTAVFASGQTSVEAPAGATFTYTESTRGDETVVHVSVAAGSQAITLDSGNESVEVLGGQQASAQGGQAPVAPVGTVHLPSGVLAQGTEPTLGQLVPDVELGGSAVLPPPDTVNQDIATVSPSAPQ